MIELLGIGNAIQDRFCVIDNAEPLERLGIKEGSITHIDEALAYKIEKEFPNAIVLNGGSAANTIKVAKTLGMEAIFWSDFAAKQECQQSDNSGKAFIFINKSSHTETRAVLPATNSLSDKLCKEMFIHSNYVHVEGYIFRDREFTLNALKLAKESGCKISVDIAKTPKTKEEREFIISIIHNFADILFANCEQATALLGIGLDQALQELGTFCNTVVITLGDKGSIIRHKGKNIQIEALPQETLDTTGAGDAYAGAFLFAHSFGLPLPICGEIGAKTASLMVATIGTELSPTAKEQLINYIRQYTNHTLHNKI